MENYYLHFAIPLVISFFVTPLVLKMALSSGCVDEPGGRKIHTCRKPLLGGVSLYIAILVSSLVFYDYSKQLVALVLGMTIIVITGIIDDRYNMSPYAKLTGQFIAAAVLVVLSTPAFDPVLAFLNSYLYFPVISYTMVIIWIVAIVNAFNLIDGVDGLATGSAMIIGVFMVLLSIIYGNMWVLGFSIILIGACIGFLPYNFQPARIFLGDTGSMLLGYILAAVFLFNIQYSVSSSLFFGVVFLFIYPVVDTTYAILRRLKNRKPIFRGDNEHIHHQILKKGIPVRYAVCIIYAISFMVGVAGILVIRFPYWQVYAFIAVPLSLFFIIHAYKSISHRICLVKNYFIKRKQNNRHVRDSSVF